MAMVYSDRGTEQSLGNAGLAVAVKPAVSATGCVTRACKHGLVMRQRRRISAPRVHTALPLAAAVLKQVARVGRVRRSIHRIQAATLLLLLLMMMMTLLSVGNRHHDFFFFFFVIIIIVIVTQPKLLHFTSSCIIITFHKPHPRLLVLRGCLSTSSCS